MWCFIIYFHGCKCTCPIIYNFHKSILKQIHLERGTQNTINMINNFWAGCRQQCVAGLNKAVWNTVTTSASRTVHTVANKANTCHHFDGWLTILMADWPFLCSFWIWFRAYYTATLKSHTCMHLHTHSPPFLAHTNPPLCHFLFFFIKVRREI